MGRGQKSLMEFRVRFPACDKFAVFGAGIVYMPNPLPAWVFLIFGLYRIALI